MTLSDYGLVRSQGRELQHAGKVLTHRLLLQELWGENSGSGYLRVYVGKLRQKIEIDPRRPQYVLTENGVGHRLKESDWT
jgi:two-component system KDP operon response regulator KdpE